MERGYVLVFVALLFLIGIVFAVDENFVIVDNKILQEHFNDDAIIKNFEMSEGQLSLKEEDGIDVVEAITTSPEGIIQYHDENEIVRKFANLEKGANVFKFDKDGRLLVADFKTTKDGNYRLGNYEYEVHSGSQVIFQIAENGNPDSVKIIQPESKEVRSPKIIDSDGEKKINLEIVSEGEGSLKVSTETLQSLERTSSGSYNKKATSLFFSWENGKLRLFSKDKASVFLNDKGQIDFSVINLGDEIDIVFDSKNIDASKNTLLIQRNVVASISPNGEGPVVNLGVGNRFDAGINKEGKIDIGPDKKTITYQGINGYAHLTRDENGENPLLRLQGESKYGPDSVSFTGRDGNFYYNPNANIAGVNHGKGAAALNVELFGKDNEQLGQVLLTNNENQHVMTPFSGLKGPAKYFVGDKGNVFSAKVSVNLMSPQERKVKFGVTISNQMENQIHKFINQYRSIRDEIESELKYDKRIAAVSLEHSKDMARRNSMDHNGFKDRSRKLGGASENVAMFSSYQKYTPEQVGKKFANLWINSKGHRENIMGSHSRTGVGVYMVERREGYYVYYATQMFQ